MRQLIALAIFILDVIAIVDVVRSSIETYKKILWIILILVLPFVGMLLWFLLGRSK